MGISVISQHAILTVIPFPPGGCSPSTAHKKHLQETTTLSLGLDPAFENHVAARLTSLSLQASSGQWIPYNCLPSKGRLLCS